MTKQSYDVVVIGGGHAGCEAAAASARMGVNTALITRERHRVKLNECLKEIDNFLKKDQNKDLELAAEDLRMATRHLGSIVGKVDVEEILGSIFKDFCIGK